MVFIQIIFDVALLPVGNTNGDCSCDDYVVY